MGKYSCTFRVAASKRKLIRNVMLEREESDAAKVVDDCQATLAAEYKVRPAHVVMLAIAPVGAKNGKPWKRPADAPPPPDGLKLDDEYTGPTRAQIAALSKADLIDLILAKSLEIDTDGNVEQVRAAVVKALKPPR